MMTMLSYRVAAETEAAAVYTAVVLSSVERRTVQQLATERWERRERSGLQEFSGRETTATADYQGRLLGEFRIKKFKVIFPQELHFV